MSCCGSSGFTPEGTQEQSQNLNTLMEGNIGSMQNVPQYADNGMYAGTNSQFVPNANPSQQSGFYNPGSSGYNYMAGAGGYNPSTINLQDMAKQYYQPVLANTQQATMQGGQNAANQLMGQLGARGIQGGGVAQMAQGNLGQNMANQMAQNTANIGMQQANTLTGLGQTSALANQQAQNQASQYNLTNYLQAVGAQQQGDIGARAQQMQNYNMPIQQMLQLYGMNMQAPGNQPQAGFFDKMMSW